MTQSISFSGLYVVNGQRLRMDIEEVTCSSARDCFFGDYTIKCFLMVSLTVVLELTFSIRNHDSAVASLLTCQPSDHGFVSH